jgi:hypothetical protein
MNIPTDEFVESVKKNTYLEEYMSSSATQNILMWHRGSRKTTALLNKLIIEVHKKVGLYWYIGPYLVQAISTVWTDPNTSIFRWIPEEYKNKISVNNSDHSLIFPNKSIIQLKGADHKEGLRGPKPVGIVVDEYGAIAHRFGSELREAILEPSIRSSGGWIDYAGTPSGSNDFSRLLELSKHHKDNMWGSLRTVDDTGIYTPEQIQKFKEDAINIDFFNQEYYCKIVEGANTVFRGVDNVIKGELQSMPIFGDNGGHQYIFGIDLGRSNDSTVIVGIDKMTNGVCFYEKMTNVPWESQKVRIRAILRQWDGIAVVDATGVGDSFVEALFNEGLPIIPFKISSNLVKKNLIDKLKTYIENSYISIPNIPDLISELKTFEIKASSRSDVFLFSAPEGMHDDSVMALALAVSKLDSSAVIYQQSSVSAEDRQSLNIDPHTGYVV